MNAIVLGFIRHALTAAGGALVAKGYLTTPDVEAVVGAVLGLIGVGLSVYDKLKNR